MPSDQRSGIDRRRRRPDQDRLRSIVERMADGVVIVSLDGVIEFANPAAAHLFGRPVTQLVGTPLGSPAIAGDVAEIEVVRPEGGTIAVELRIVDTDWDGDRARLASLRDITDRKRAQEHAAQLERERIARAEAEAANQAKSDFLATMSHELRTPLNAIIGYSDLLDLEIAGSLTPDQRHHIVRIRTSGRHLLGLVNEVLDLAKVEAGQLTLQPGIAHVGHAVDGALAVIQTLAESRGIQLTALYLDGTESAYEGDEDRVRQILVNLLNNAVKFTPPAGRITVECGRTTRPDSAPRLRAGVEWTYFRVDDTGVGIPADQLTAIFDPFVQVMTGHTRPKDGSGLGLTISRRLARMMKGDLTVGSEPGAGSAFTLWLPAAPVGSATERSPSPRVTEGTTALGLRGTADVGEMLIRETAAVLDAFVARLRAERIVPAAESLRFSHLADHIGTYIADLAGILIALEEAGGQPSGLLTDGTDIQRFVAERHGAQRARLGWTREALHREWEILSQEIEQAVRARATRVSVSAQDEALKILRRFVEQGEALSCRALTRDLSGH
jgi:signal transduction histidine kinase